MNKGYEWLLVKCLIPRSVEECITSYNERRWAGEGASHVTEGRGYTRWREGAITARVSCWLSRREQAGDYCRATPLQAIVCFEVRSGTSDSFYVIVL